MRVDQPALPLAVSTFETEDRRMRELVRSLHAIRPAVYWTDLLITASTGWTAFALAVMLRPFSIAMLMAAAIAVLALYRGLLFIHEISHQGARSLPGSVATAGSSRDCPSRRRSATSSGASRAKPRRTAFASRR